MVICPHCKKEWVGAMGCVNPNCEYKKTFSFVKGTLDEEKQAVINNDYTKWLETKGGSQTSPNEKGQNVLSEPIIQDPVSPMPQQPEEKRQEVLNQNDTGLGTKEESETPYIPAAGKDFYKLGWGREHPGHIVYLIDLSESMGYNDGRNIKDVMEVVFNCMYYFVGVCTTKAGLVPRLTASVIGYNSKIIPLLKHGSIEEIEELISIDPEKETLFDISETGDACPRWQTMTAEAFDAARQDVEEWMAGQKNTPMPAPYVIHITDGHPEQTDPATGKPIAENILMNRALKAAEKLKGLHTEDGNLLLFNVHYNTNGQDGSNHELITPAQRPTGSTVFDKRRQFLYDASSELPAAIIDSIQSFYKREKDHILKTNVRSGSRALISNTRNKSLLSDFVVFSSKSALAKTNNISGK